MNFSTPTWEQLGDKQREIDELHAENALKLTQILDLEQLLYETAMYCASDGSPCWCGQAFLGIEHEDTCIKARQSTEPFWKKPNEQK